MDSFLQRSLLDVVKGLRQQGGGGGSSSSSAAAAASSAAEGRYLAQVLEEVRTEARSSDAGVKAVALQKLAYLHMLQGADMAWAAFHCVEAMASPRAAVKARGYEAAARSFRDDTQVALLATNLLRKDMAAAAGRSASTGGGWGGGSSSGTGGSEGGGGGAGVVRECALALNCLACVATPELARDLLPDVLALLGSSRALVRRRAVLSLLRLLRRHPGGLQVAAVRRLVERLDDSDPQVVSAAVSVLAELALAEPRPYLPLAPPLFRLLTASSSNGSGGGSGGSGSGGSSGGGGSGAGAGTTSTWVMIKLVKVFGALAPLEPRLGRKLAGPLAEIMRTTRAKSLLLECVRTATALAAPLPPGLVALAVEKLGALVEGRDPNLRYLALRTLARLLPAHAPAVAGLEPAIVARLRDEDDSARACALALLAALVTRDSLAPTVGTLLTCMRNAGAGTGAEAGMGAGARARALRSSLVGAVLAMGGHDAYARVGDAAWYTDVLAEVACAEGSIYSEEAGRQLLEVALQFAGARPRALQAARRLLLDAVPLAGERTHPTLHHAVAASAWLIGEFGAALVSPEEAVEALLQPRLRRLPPAVQAVCLRAVFKLCVAAAAASAEAPVEMAIAATATAGQAAGGALLAGGEGEQGHVVPGGCAGERAAGGREEPAALVARLARLVKVHAATLVGSSDSVEVEQRACCLLALLPLMSPPHARADAGVAAGAATLQHHHQQQSAAAPPPAAALLGMFSKAVEAPDSDAPLSIAPPPGLVLHQSLAVLDQMAGCEWLQLQPAGAPGGWDDGPLFVRPSADEAERRQVSAQAQLSQHRERHSAFYLPSAAPARELAAV